MRVFVSNDDKIRENVDDAFCQIPNLILKAQKRDAVESKIVISCSYCYEFEEYLRMRYKLWNCYW